MKKGIVSLLFILVVFLSYGQQDPQFSQNMFNRLPVNPAYAGSHNALCGTLIARNQWIGFEGAPKTGMLSVDAAVPALWGGLGATVGYDKLGYERNLSLKLAYAFRFPVASGKLALGIDAGFLQKGIFLNGDKWNAVDDYTSDPSIPPVNGSSDMAPDFSLGAYYNTNNLYFGLSTTHLAKGDIQYNKAISEIARHYYIIAGYDYELNPSIVIKPSVWVKSDAVKTIADVNVNVLYNNLLWGGITYRYTDAIIALIGLNFNNFKFGYSYDVTTSSIRGYSSGTHEIVLGYCMNINRPKPLPKNGNVRFLNY